MSKGHIAMLWKCECLYMWNLIFMVFTFMEAEIILLTFLLLKQF